jgi:hypothetical protein
MTQHDLTAQIAYLFFVERGCVHGRHREDWAAAEAVVELCLAFFAAAAPPATLEEAGPAEVAFDAPAPDPRVRALEVLHAAVADLGRKAVAKQLGYKSTSSVGRYVRGDRPLGEVLAARILATFVAPAPASAPAARRAA